MKTKTIIKYTILSGSALLLIISLLSEDMVLRYVLILTALIMIVCNHLGLYTFD